MAMNASKATAEARIAQSADTSNGGREDLTSDLPHITNDELPQLSLRARTWRFLEEPTSSSGARIYSIAIIGLITSSVVAFCVESLPQYYTEGGERKGSVWDNIEVVSVAIFSAEFFLRLAVCPSKRRFFLNPINFVDLVAIVPFYLERYLRVLSGSNAAVFRVVRLVRVFRVFKISRYVSWIRIFAEAMIQSAQPLMMLLFVMMIGCVFFSSAMFFLERGDFNEENAVYYRSDGKVSPFQSIPGTFWWCLVTMTTVGYGDAVPITSAGKLLASITSLTGILVLAIPITIISTNFGDEYEKLKKQRKMARARAMLLKGYFKDKKTGLDTMNLEIEDMVKRSTMTFMKEMEELVEASKDEMVLELQQLVKLAYKSRQSDLGMVRSTRRLLRVHGQQQSSNFSKRGTVLPEK
mmetsp:Transcript_24174/g.77204  ORF Transcript_24174/g.77204 Transcript_24174/m.77204 type:complete len:410 (-) Transcript_24174:1236-2465(-)